MAGKRALIIVNPGSGRSSGRMHRVNQLVKLLAADGVVAEALETEGPGHASRLAAQAVTSGTDLVVAYGGDGTMNESIQSMVGSQSALVVWPGGTANVAAKEIGMPSDPRDIARAISAGNTRRVAVGLVELGGDGAEPRPRRYFLLFAGFGLDASIAKRVNPALKRRTGEFAYWAEGFRHLFSWRRPVFSLEANGEKWTGTFALVAKASRFGGGIRFAPNAGLGNPRFEVFVIPRLSNNLSYIYDLAVCYVGLHGLSRGKRFQVSSVAAASSDEIWVETDGEVIGKLPATCSVVPDALSVVVP